MPINDEGKRLVIPYDEWNYIDTYKGMQKLVELGLTKAIGVSNYNIPKLKEILNDKEIKIKPVCNQVEMHPSLPQIELIEFCKKNNILIQCYSPLGSTGAPVLENEILQNISKKNNISPACLAISWAVARGTVVLPKSVSSKRIIDNIKIVQLDENTVKELESIGIENPQRVGNPPWDVKINLFEDSEVY